MIDSTRMALESSAGPVYQFGDFQVDPRSGELRKRGIKIKLQDQPLRVLVALLDNPGQVVSREQLQKNLWPDGTYVDYENAINSAVRKLRDALNDNADNPRFIETLTRRGYRFIAPVSRSGDSPVIPFAAPSADEAPVTVVEQTEKPGGRSRTHPSAKVALPVAVLIVLCVLLFAYGLAGTAASPILEAGVALTGYPGNERQLSFSPDGSRIAYSWNGAERSNYDIYVKLIGAAGEPLRLTWHPEPDTDPVWSPDGRSIAFLRAVSRSAHKLVVVPAMGKGGERELTEIDLPFYNSLTGPRVSWSADSKWLYTTEGRDPLTIIRVSVDNAAKAPVTFPPDARDVSVAVSPDGLRIAFGRVVPPASIELFVARLGPELEPAGKPQRLTFDARHISGIAWTPDSGKIIFSSDRRGRRELWRIDADGRKPPDRLTGAGEGATWVAISRQGQRLAYSQAHSSGRDMWSIPSVGGEPPVRVSFHQRGSDLSPAWSADSSRIAFDSDRSGNHEIWVSNADGTLPGQITNLRKWSGSPAWSPDDRIAFDSNASGNWDIYVVNPADRKPRMVTSNAASDTAPSWSLDGNWIYFASNRSGRSEIWKVPADGGPEVPVTTTGGHSPRESPDGFLYYTRDRVRGELWRVPAAGGEILVTNRVFYASFAPGREGRVFFLERTLHGALVQLLRPGSGSVETLAPLDSLNAIHLALSPNEKTLLFTMDRHAGMEIMVVDGFR